MTHVDIIISQPWGGLGDNLQYSTLPELYSKLGHKVYISSTNAYRNPEIYDLVWKLNPYVSGISDAPANAGACKHYINNPEYSFVKNWELAHGLVNGYRDYPVVYYVPNIIQDLSNVVLYDVTSISTNPHDDTIDSCFKSIFNTYIDSTIKKIEFTKINNRVLSNFSHEIYTINTIFDMCDALYSCKAFIGLFSGSSVLAAALKQYSQSPELHIFKPSIIGPPPFYQFKNVIYTAYN
jgi:hypothetical protein